MRATQKNPPGPRVIFITGTDTGVGKTLVTALLLAHRRAEGEPAYALKPFCSGSRADAELLHCLQDGDLNLKEINPFFFAEPLAPWIAARRAKRPAPALSAVVAHIRTVCAKIEPSASLFIEGAGGLLVPLGEDFTMLDLIVALRCETILVSRNQLGTINHTLLSVRALSSAWQERVPRPQRTAIRSASTDTLASKLRVVLMNTRNPDPSAASNPLALSHLLTPVPLISVPFLGRFASSISSIRRNEKKIKKTLARILD